MVLACPESRRLTNRKIGLPDRGLRVRKGLREDIGGHQLRVRAVHVDVIGLQPGNTYAMRSADVGHVRVLARPQSWSQGRPS